MSKSEIQRKKERKKERKKRQRKRSARYLKQLFAAYHFLHTSRDGAVIAHIVGAEPIDLHRWTETQNWIEALRFWNSDYQGTTELQGDYFKSVVGDSIVERSLNHASTLWNALFEGRETRDLQKTLNLFQEMGFTE